MKPKTLSLGICIIVLIALVFITGCTFPSAQNTPAQTGSPAATVVTTAPAATVTPAGSAVPTSAVVSSATTNPWVNFKEPTTAAGAVTTGEPTVIETEAPTPLITETPFVEVTLTEPPTPVPTTPSVNDTCSNIGGNICMANQTCSGAYIKTTDEPKCCAGVCQ
jgi:hypothetical protein